MTGERGTRQYMLKLALIKSISSFPISYALNVAIIIPLILFLTAMGVSLFISGLVLALPFVAVSIIKNYTFFWAEQKYTITLNPRVLLSNLRSLFNC